MMFHTFISYFLLGNLIHYLLLITCRSLILQSDIVEARAHYPVLTSMLHLIVHHLTQQPEVGRRSPCDTVEEYILLFQILFLFYNANPRVDCWNSSTHTSDPANVLNLPISREFLPSTQDMNFQANIFR